MDSTIAKRRRFTGRVEAPKIGRNRRRSSRYAAATVTSTSQPPHIADPCKPHRCIDRDAVDQVRWNRTITQVCSAIPTEPAREGLFPRSDVIPERARKCPSDVRMFSPNERANALLTFGCTPRTRAQGLFRCLAVLPERARKAISSVRKPSPNAGQRKSGHLIGPNMGWVGANFGPSPI